MRLIFHPLSAQGDSPFGKSEAYIKLEQLGEGSYATVFKGYSKWVSPTSLEHWPEEELCD